MRLFAACLLLFLSFCIHAEGLRWLGSDLNASRGHIVHLGSVDTEAVEAASALGEQEWAYARWGGAAPDAEALLAELASKPALDPSRLVLVAESGQTVAALALVDTLLTAGETAHAPKGLVLHIDRAMSWPRLERNADWPALYLAYDSANGDVRDATFALARSARRAGASVFLRPAAAGTRLLELPQFGGWLSMLDLPRVQSFEDALVDVPRDEPTSADRAALETLAAASADPGARIAEVIDAAGADATLRVLLDGRLLRESASAPVALEFDARAALAGVFGAPIERIEFAKRAVPLLHPESGQELLAIPVWIHGPGRERSVLLLRRPDASYAFLDLDDPRRVDAVLASSDAGDRGRVWWLQMAGPDVDGKRLLRVELQNAAPRRGVWWDPTRPGHGIDLQPVFGGHSLVFATYDDSGESRWYLASGRIEAGRFVGSGEGLMLMRRADALSAPTADPKRSGSLELVFGIDAGHPACRARAAKSNQLALFRFRLGGRDESWCIEPVPLPAGVPERDVNGAWYGGGGDSGWGLSVVSAGNGPGAMLSAILYYHDPDGWPRWALGGGPRSDSGAAISMFEYHLDCGDDCRSVRPSSREAGEIDLRTAGWCGAPELRAAIRLGRFQRDEFALKQVSEKRCY